MSSMQVKQRTYSDDTIKEEEGEGPFSYFHDQQQQPHQSTDSRARVNNRISAAPASHLQAPSDALPPYPHPHSHHQHGGYHQNSSAFFGGRQTNPERRPGVSDYAGAPAAPNALPSHQWEDYNSSFSQGYPPALPPMQMAKDQISSYLDGMDKRSVMHGSAMDIIHSNASYPLPLMRNGSDDSNGSQCVVHQPHHHFHQHGSQSGGVLSNNPYALQTAPMPPHGHGPQNQASAAAMQMSSRTPSPDTVRGKSDIDVKSFAAASSRRTESGAVKTGHACYGPDKRGASTPSDALFIETREETTLGKEKEVVSDPFEEAARCGVSNSNLSPADAEQIQKQCEALSCGGSMFNISPRSFLMGRFKKARTVSHDNEWN